MDEKICRLCLKTCGSIFEVIQEIHQKKLNLLLVNVNLAISYKPVICKSCADNLQNCFAFKMASLLVEDSVVVFAKKQRNGEVNLREYYVETVPNDHNVCRFCMEVVKHRLVISINDERLDVLLTKSILEQYFPEIDLRITKEPVICMLCYEIIQNCISFIINCLTVDKRISRYCETEGACSKRMVELTRLLYFESQSTLEGIDNCSGQNTVKNENISYEEGDRNFVKVENNFETNEAVSKRDYNERKTGSAEIDVKGEDIKKAQEKWCENVEMELENVKMKKIWHAEENEKSNVELEVKDEKTSEETETLFIKTDADNMETYMGNDEKEQSNDSSRSQTKNLRLPKSEIRKMVTYDYVSGQRMYKCTICKFTAETKSCVNHHMSVHQDRCQLLFYQCHVCGLLLTSRYGLKRHMLVHKDSSEVTMYKCEFCTSDTIHRSNHKYNIFMHENTSKVQIFECDTCDFKTRNKNNFTRHLLIHKKPEVTSSSKMYK